MLKPYAGEIFYVEAEVKTMSYTSVFESSPLYHPSKLPSNSQKFLEARRALIKRYSFVTTTTLSISSIMTSVPSTKNDTVVCDYEEVVTEPLPQPLPPRALPHSDSELRKRLRKRKTIAISLFVITVLLMGYVIMLGTGFTAPIGYPGTYTPCDNQDLVGGLQSLVAIDIWFVRGLAFSAAKSIDVTLDLVVGQGGRALHILVG